jgi:hypothetical protein
MTVTIEWEIEYISPSTNEIDYVYVDFIGDVVSENNGIGPYEFWGIPGYDSGQDYLVCEKIEWDKSKHTTEQNIVIDKYLEDNYDLIEEALCS